MIPELLVHQQIFSNIVSQDSLPDIEYGVCRLTLRGPGIRAAFTLGGRFVEALSRHKTVKILDIRGTGIDDEGAKGIAEIIRRTRSLQKLDLSGNNMTEKGRLLVLDAFKTNGIVLDILFDCE